MRAGNPSNFVDCRKNPSDSRLIRIFLIGKW